MRYLKHLMLAVLLATTALAVAEDFRLKFQEKEQETFVELFEKDWNWVGTEHGYAMYVNIEPVDNTNKLWRMHALTVLSQPYQFANVPVPVSRMITYGVIQCEAKQAVIYTEFFLEDNNKIASRQSHQAGEFVAEMAKPGTLRNQVYAMACLSTAI